MIIYGVSLLSFCALTGLYVGELIGMALGVEVDGRPANIGGVGIAMLLLIVVSNYGTKYVRIDDITSDGITFWSAMYIPIVVAMAAKQNVFGALTGGPLALLAGLLAVVASFALIPLMSRLGKNETVDPGSEKES